MSLCLEDFWVKGLGVLKGILDGFLKGIYKSFRVTYYTINAIRDPQNSMGSYLGPYSSICRISGV